MSQGKSADAFALFTAVWIRFLQGRADTGGPITPNDPLAEALMLAAGSDVADVAQALGLSNRLPFSSEGWRSQVAGHLAALRKNGAVAFAEALA